MTILKWCTMPTPIDAATDAILDTWSCFSNDQVVDSPENFSREFAKSALVAVANSVELPEEVRQQLLAGI